METINSDLANVFGNLVSRTVAMVEKYFGGTLPEVQAEGEFDDSLIETAMALKAEVDKYIDETQLNNALAEIFKVVNRANKYIDETMPWVLAKDEAQKPRLARVLYNLLEAIRVATTPLSCFMPSTMPKVWEQIGMSSDDATYENIDKWGVLPANVTVKRGEVLFPRIDVEKEIEELNKFICNNETKAEEPKVEIPEGLAPIGIEDFCKVDLRVAKITACEPVKKAKKLLKLTVFDGIKERTVASGIAKYYKPDELVGKSVILVSNLKPATLCGIESAGMILAATSGEDVKVIFVDGVPAGSKIS